MKGLDETHDLAEIALRGPIQLPTGETRRFLEDGDESPPAATALLVLDLVSARRWSNPRCPGRSRKARLSQRTD